MTLSTTVLHNSPSPRHSFPAPTVATAGQRPQALAGSAERDVPRPPPDRGDEFGTPWTRLAELRDWHAEVSYVHAKDRAVRTCRPSSREIDAPCSHGPYLLSIRDLEVRLIDMIYSAPVDAENVVRTAKIPETRFRQWEMIQTFNLPQKLG